MEKVTFKKGDRVRLKSGGPSMVIVGENYGSEWYCSWFPATDKGWADEPSKESFPPEALELDTETKE